MSPESREVGQIHLRLAVVTQADGRLRLDQISSDGYALAIDAVRRLADGLERDTPFLSWSGATVLMDGSVSTLDQQLDAVDCFLTGASDGTLVVSQTKTAP